MTKKKKTCPTKVVRIIIDTLQKREDSVSMNAIFIERMFNPLFKRFCKKGDHRFFCAKDFGPTESLELGFGRIRDELDRVMLRVDEFTPFQELSPDQKHISNDDKWKMFFLKVGNICFERNCQQFPELMAILEENPEIVSAYFSVLGPRKMLRPHKGPWCGVLRAHMGMIIPSPRENCALVIEDEVYHWREGEVVVFDDTYTHFAMNNTDSYRVVLFMDILRPLPWPLHILNLSVLYLARFLPYLTVPMKRHKQWEHKFYGDTEDVY